MCLRPLPFRLKDIYGLMGSNFASFLFLCMMKEERGKKVHLPCLDKKIHRVNRGPEAGYGEIEF